MKISKSKKTKSYKNQLEILKTALENTKDYFLNIIIDESVRNNQTRKYQKDSNYCQT